MSETTTEVKKRGRPAVWGTRVKVLTRIDPDLHSHLVSKAQALGYQSLGDYAWTLLDEGSGYDGEVPLPDPQCLTRNASRDHTPSITPYTPGLVPYADRVQVAIRVTEDMHAYLTKKAARLGYASLSEYAWALLNEESSFDGEAPEPRYVSSSRRGHQMTA